MDQNEWTEVRKRIAAGTPPPPSWWRAGDQFMLDGGAERITRGLLMGGTAIVLITGAGLLAWSGLHLIPARPHLRAGDGPLLDHKRDGTAPPADPRFRPLRLELRGLPGERGTAP